MRTWLRSLVAALLWAFLACALLGLGEALLLGLREPSSAPGGEGFSILRRVLPVATAYGWCGLLIALAAYGPARLVARRSADPDLRARAMSVAVATAAILLMQLGFGLREFFDRGRWLGIENRLLLTLFPILYIVLTTLLAALLRRLPARWVRSRALLIGAPAIIIVLSAAWPDRVAEGRRHRRGGVDLIAEAPARAPNVLLITVDALRRNAPSCLGGPTPTPALDRFAADGLLYTNAWSPSCWTLPALSAMVTGLPPRAIGMDVWLPLPRSLTTMAETALAAGWGTGAVLTNPYLTSDYGLDMGFDRYEHAMVIEPLLPIRDSMLARSIGRLWRNAVDTDDAGYVLEKSSRMLAELDAEPAPWFFWTHLMETHLPYRTHPPEAAGRAPYRADLPDHDLFDRHGLRMEHLEWLRRDAATLPDSLREGVKSCYRDELTYLDARLGRFLADLETAGLLEGTLVILAADHGEELFEHDGFEHGHSMMPEVTGVPLMIHLPDGGGSGVTIDRDCSLLDILPTLCARLGWTPPPGLEGCRDLWTGEAGIGADCGSSAARQTIIEKMLYGHGHSAGLAWPWLAYRIEGEGTRWFDLSDDPGAFRPRSAPAPADSLTRIFHATRARLDAKADLLREETAGSRGPSAEVREQLESLGY